MKELCERGSYALFPDRFLRCGRPNIHAKPACRSKKRLTYQEFMPSDYYTSYIPFITATPKEDFIPIGSTNRKQIGGRKLLSTSRIVLYIAETVKNRTIPFVLVWFCVSISSLFLMALKNIRILCLGFLCVSLKSLFFKATKNKVVLSYGLLCFMLFNLSDAWAQSAESRTAEGQTEIKPLQIGDTIPEELWNLPLQVVNHPEGKDTITLNDYRDKKLIILDFWATWCGSCIENIPHITELQKKFDNDFAAIFVNSKKGGDTKPKIESFLAKREKYTGDKLLFTSVVRDTALTELFPYRFIPHYVWLVDGEVVAITSAHEVNEENIQAALLGVAEDIHTKTDIVDFDPKEPLFAYLHQEMKGEKFFQSTFTGYLEGAGIWSGKNIDANSKVWRYYIINKPLIEIVQTAVPEVRVPKNRLIIEGEKGTERVLYDSLFCYEIIAKPTTTERMLDFLRTDIERYFGIGVKKETRRQEVWVLTKIEDNKNLRSTGEKPMWRIDKKAKEKFIRNMPVSALVDVLNTLSPIPVVDETGITSPIDIDLPRSLHQIPISESNSYLIKYGLRLEKEERETKFTIINL
ncbi:redoxin family protein [Sphingobacterium gobiense]|uniref:Thioredoxin domain-containing protein n=1 Tax=Sphingobacterium gobiense TaxID=1382456 RepID=A0A2S9JSC7_9SPHI|nr:redoxin family protein [Sphingobacterium gobiense]PRD56041.1 hypothetical protein C5749_01760 [Sphingobacterium gobiense]